MMKNLQRGFTLIELLVVIAIIGILASVVLASLNTARDSGTDAANTASINNMRAQAELYYSNNNGSYVDVCTDPTIAGALADIAQGTGCASNATAYAIAVDLLDPSGDNFCVDSTGQSGEFTAAAATEDDDFECDGDGT